MLLLPCVADHVLWLQYSDDPEVLDFSGLRFPKLKHLRIYNVGLEVTSALSPPFNSSSLGASSY